MSADHTADRYERLRQAFLAVCEVPTGEREAALDAACGGDDSLRAEVHDLGIHVTVLCPGFIATELTKYALTGDGSLYGRGH